MNSGIAPRSQPKIAAALFAIGLIATGTLPGQSQYFPPAAGFWETKSPEEAGFDPAKLRRAVEFAIAHEVPWAESLVNRMTRTTAAEPAPGILGPLTERGRSSGIILKDGYIVAEWGDTGRVDMTFSVAKSYLSTLAGLALDLGLIPSLDDKVAATVRDGGFDGPHNGQITWRMLLNQTSEWHGELWGKPDSADRRRGTTRTLETPGTFWEYNDVRINRTALALLRVFKQPLPTILKERILDPIGASDTWIWHGYDNSWVAIDGKSIQSVSGGGHWGGGLWTTTRDMARFGLLLQRGGVWEKRQIISRQWITEATTPTAIQPNYGLLWWLNRGGEQIETADPAAFFALGGGGNVIWIDPEESLVVVLRWFDWNERQQFGALLMDALDR